MLFENLKVDRLIVHEVAKRTNDGPKDPTLSSHFEVLNDEATSVFCSRLSDALGSASRSVEMALGNTGEGSMFALVCKLLQASEEANFIALSQDAAWMLVRAQTAMTIPGGLLMVFEGKVGAPSRRYMGFLKAEPQTGFRQHMLNGKSLLEFINKLFLTPDSKVYKIGLFVEKGESSEQKQRTSQDFSCYLFDANITSKETAKAATYFYETFLGMTHLRSDAATTRKFIEVTKKFISKLDIDEEERIDISSALISYVRTDQAQVVSVSEFATKYLSDPDLRDSYEGFCRKNNLPEHAFTKNLDESKSLLRRRKVRFGNDVQLSGPADKFGDLVEITTIPGTNDEPWTQITVKAKLIGEQ